MAAVSFGKLSAGQLLALLSKSSTRDTSGSKLTAGTEKDARLKPVVSQGSLSLTGKKKAYTDKTKNTGQCVGEKITGRKTQKSGVSKILKSSNLERIFETQLKIHCFDGFVREYKFCENRRFRFDFAWVEKKIAVEIEGGTWSGGRHTTGAGFRGDCEKYNIAAKLGWRVFRFTVDQVKSAEAINFLLEVFL